VRPTLGISGLKPPDPRRVNAVEYSVEACETASCWCVVQEVRGESFSTNWRGLVYPVETLRAGRCSLFMGKFPKTNSSRCSAESDARLASFFFRARAVRGKPCSHTRIASRSKLGKKNLKEQSAYPANFRTTKLPRQTAG